MCIRDRRHAIPGWQLANVAAQENSIQTIAGIAKNPAVDFVAPVFLDSFGGPFFPTRDILLRFNDTVPHDCQTEILADLDIGEVLDVNWGNMRNAYRIRSSSKNGFDVLQQAEDFSLMAEIEWAEPDMVFTCLLYTSPSPRDATLSRMPSSA